MSQRNVELVRPSTNVWDASSAGVGSVEGSAAIRAFLEDRLRDGRPARIEVYTDENEAFKALGLEV